MSRYSAVLLGSNTTDLSYTGDKIRTGNFHGYRDGLSTVSIQLNDFVGRVYIEGTLADDPGTTDWFPVFLQSKLEYTEYPKDAGNLLGGGSNGDTTVDAYSFYGNFTYLRARVDRSYLSNPVLGSVGSVVKILLNS